MEDVRIKDFREGQLVNIRVMYNVMYNTSPSRGIKNAAIKNLSHNGSHANPSIFAEYNKIRMIPSLTFENLVINSKQTSDTM